ncbi:MAG: hypothetical protein AAGA90_03880 [Actinomycetota bacterium]
MSLRLATGILAVGFVLHNADHWRRGFGVVEDGVILGGTMAAMLIAVLFTLVVARHPAAPAAAAVVGLSVAFGVSMVHLVPGWGPPSDYLPDAGADALTYTAVIAEIGAAALVGVVGLQILRRNDFAPLVPGWA